MSLRHAGESNADRRRLVSDGRSNVSNAFLQFDDRNSEKRFERHLHAEHELDVANSFARSLLSQFSETSDVEIRREFSRCSRNFQRRPDEQSDFSLARHRWRRIVSVSQRFHATVRDRSFAAFSQHVRHVVHRQRLDQSSFVEQRNLFDQFGQRHFRSERPHDDVSFAPPDSSLRFPTLGILRRRCQCLNDCPNQPLDSRKNRFVSLCLSLPSSFVQLAFVYDYALRRQFIYVDGILNKYEESRGPYNGTSGSLTIGTGVVSAPNNSWDGCLDQMTFQSYAKK